MQFPSFSAGDDSWTVACNGQGLMIRGNVRPSGSTTSEPVNSLIPLAAISSLQLSRDAGAAKINLRIWDGAEHSFGVVHGGSAEIIGGLQALTAEVAKMNATWPLSSSRAAFARQQTPAGYLRDAILLGTQGREEFWSPLSELPWTWANAWHRSGHSGTWPQAALPTVAPLGLLVLISNAAVFLSEDASSVDIPYDALGTPRVVARTTAAASHESLDVPPELGLQLQSAGQEPITLYGVTGRNVQLVYRYLLARWAENYAARFDNSVEAAVTAADELNQGVISALEYATILDAVIAQTTGTPLSRHFPPRERDYLRADARPASTSSRPSTTPQQVRPQLSRPGVNARQVAAGAAAGAALWSLFSD